MKMQHRVTWLLPVKNGMPYLPETLASIEDQTYSDWEVLVWDNGSTDGTLEELEKWVPSRLPGRIIRDEPLPLGLSLRRLVEEAGTELCARIDSDDVSLPQRLEKQVRYMEEHPEIAVLGTQVNRLDVNSRSFDLHCPRPIAHEDIVCTMFREWGIWHPSVLFRRSAVLKAGNYEDRSPVEDYDLWLRIALENRLANLPEALVNYRIRPDSITQVNNRNHRLHDARVACLSRYSERLYGCTPREMKNLHDRTHRFALLTLIKSWRYMQRQFGSSATLLPPLLDFIERNRSFVSQRDLVSRGLIKIAKSTRPRKREALSYMPLLAWFLQ